MEINPFAWIRRQVIPCCLASRRLTLANDVSLAWIDWRHGLQAPVRDLISGRRCCDEQLLIESSP